jgi:hypothetical protein
MSYLKSSPIIPLLNGWVAFGVIGVHFNNFFFLLQTIIKEILNITMISLSHFNNEFDILPLLNRCRLSLFLLK